jgi:RNA polymerase sigma-70 factor (ECF subfamily)
METKDRPSVEYEREEFVRLLTGEQTRMFRYIVMLLGDLNDASNVLQQTNLVIWRKAAEFAIDSDFQLWARKIAYYQTLAFLRDRKRDKHVFDEELLTQLASRPIVVDEDERRVALRHCLATISGESLKLIQERYGPGKPISEIAQDHHRSVGAVKMALMRIRQALVHCIESQLAVTP